MDVFYTPPRHPYDSSMMHAVMTGRSVYPNTTPPPRKPLPAVDVGRTSANKKFIKDNMNISDIDGSSSS
jgi:hypothetical protein